ncbi:nitroreductase [Lysinibacillus sp. KCTC 33748]|uniref:nitroreductase family protein n=1 Tax=unclassified Lysinibacillus TaxID=2636778 RepID=UPI0009A56465|nr:MULTISPECIES: nitroreductase [unclassified Lysinibacillus]OXS66982.1 nitroreductase [Lysinibacillus sp. KCTC 33748]SKC16210.1 Nitroreductase [Lysinibacillus sp. AC-3]
MSEQVLSVRDAIIERRSIKKFNGQPVEREDLMAIIDDAVWAPNHGNREPWRLVVACGEELSALHNLLRDIAIPKWQELSSEDLAKQMTKFTLPGGYAFVIVPEDARQKERLEDYGAASIFIQNIQLLAWDKGIGSCWKTPGFLDNPKFREALKVQQGERVIAMLQVGYFDEAPKGKERKKSADIVTIFGE